MSLNDEITQLLKKEGADFVNFVDISSFSKKQNHGYPAAILMGIALSADYIHTISRDRNYVQAMIKENKIQDDEFHLKEIQTDKMADFLAKYLIGNGYSAYSQSEKNIDKTGFYDKSKKHTPFPHKTIALLAGLGWIGKHNLLITREYGSAISMCTVLTDAPLETEIKERLSPKCGVCDMCVQICPVGALRGINWSLEASRDTLVNVFTCTTCLQCMVNCPYTLEYVKNTLNHE